MKILRQHQNNTHRIEMRQLDASWKPWRYQVAKIVLDGQNYGRPGAEVETDTSNWGDKIGARQAFSRAILRLP